MAVVRGRFPRGQRPAGRLFRSSAGRRIAGGWSALAGCGAWCRRARASWQPDDDRPLAAAVLAAILCGVTTARARCFRKRSQPSLGIHHHGWSIQSQKGYVASARHRRLRPLEAPIRPRWMTIRPISDHSSRIGPCSSHFSKGRENLLLEGSSLGGYLPVFSGMTIATDCLCRATESPWADGEGPFKSAGHTGLTDQ